MGEIATDICEKKGLELETSSFLNSDKKIYVYDNEVKAREYMSYISEKAGGFCCASRTGKIQIKKLGEDEEIIPQRLFKNYKWGEQHQISRVAYEDGTRTFKVGNETKDTLWIRQENLFISEEDDIQKIYESVKDLDFYSFEGTTIINPAIDIGDILNINGKKVIYQGEMTLNKRFIADIKSKIAIKQKQETTTRKQSQQVKNRKFQSQLDEENLKLTQLAQETTENTEKLSKHEQTLESISDKVSNIEDLTNNVEGVKTIALANCVEGKLLELHIYGNNTVFDYLYPSNDLYPDDDLYPYGDSRIVVTDKDNNQTIYELGVLDVLRQNVDVYDEYILKDGKAQVIRRINKDGSIKENEEVEELGEYVIELKEGTNTIEIQNYTARIKAKWAIKSNYTDVFATKVEMNSEIKQTADSINLEVKKKVDENEVISKINQSAEAVGINANKIELSANDILNLLAGNEINLGSKKITIKSNNFNVDENGNMTCNNGNFKGIISSSEINGSIIKVGGDSDDPQFIADNGDGYRTFIYPLGLFHEYDRDSTYVAIEKGGIGLGTFSGDSMTETAQITKEEIRIPIVTQTSLQEYKKNFEKLQDNALDILKGIDIYKYNLKNEKDNDKKHIGFVIGDNYNYSKEVTSSDNKGVDNYSFTSLCCKAIQELSQKVENLENKLKEKEEK